VRYWSVCMCKQAPLRYVRSSHAMNRYANASCTRLSCFQQWTRRRHSSAMYEASSYTIRAMLPLDADHLVTQVPGRLTPSGLSSTHFNATYTHMAISDVQCSIARCDRHAVLHPPLCLLRRISCNAASHEASVAAADA
jgi:hypothetical protein